MPRLNSRKANSPAIGRSACAASRRGRDIGDAGRVQRDGRRQNNEEGDEAGKPHANVSVPGDSVEFGGRVLRMIEERAVAGKCLVFHFFRALPEEHIGADRRAEHGDDHDQHVPRPGDLRKQHPARHGAPVDGHGEDDAHIGQQAERQPFQHMHIAMIGQENLQNERPGGKQDREQRLAPAQHQLHGGTHSGEVGADVDGVGH